MEFDTTGSELLVLCSNEFGVTVSWISSQEDSCLYMKLKSLGLRVCGDEQEGPIVSTAD